MSTQFFVLPVFIQFLACIFPHRLWRGQNKDKHKRQMHPYTGQTECFYHWCGNDVNHMKYSLQSVGQKVIEQLCRDCTSKYGDIIWIISPSSRQICYDQHCSRPEMSAGQAPSGPSAVHKRGKVESHINYGCGSLWKIKSAIPLTMQMDNIWPLPAFVFFLKLHGFEIAGHHVCN